MSARQTKRSNAIAYLVEEFMTQLEHNTEEPLAEASAMAWPRGEDAWDRIWENDPDPTTRLFSFEQQLLADAMRALAERLTKQAVIVEGGPAEVSPLRGDTS